LIEDWESFGAQYVQDGVEVFAPAFGRAGPPAVQMVRMPADGTR